MVAVVAVVGGPLGLLIRSATGQHRAVLALRQRGAMVSYHDEARPAAVGDDALLQDFLADVSVVDLGDTGIGDADLVWLTEFPRLETLVLRNTAVTDGGLQCLTRLTRLKYLDLHGAHVGDDALKLIGQQAELQDLDLGGTSVTDEGLCHLSDLRQLRSLDLSGTRVTGGGLAQLDRLAQLQWLGLDGTKAASPSLDAWSRRHPQVVVSRGDMLPQVIPREPLPLVAH